MYFDHSHLCPLLLLYPSSFSFLFGVPSLSPVLLKNISKDVRPPINTVVTWSTHLWTLLRNCPPWSWSPLCLQCIMVLCPYSSCSIHRSRTSVCYYPTLNMKDLRAFQGLQSTCARFGSHVRLLL